MKKLVKEDLNESSKEYGNMWLSKLYEDLKQNKYNLIKHNLYNGLIKEYTDALISVLKNDYDIDNYKKYIKIK